MEQLERVQVLLDRAQRRALTRIAKREKRSVSAVLREIIDRGLGQRLHQDQRWKAALGELKQIRAANFKRGVYRGNIVAEARAERERQMERVWHKSS